MVSPLCLGMMIRRSNECTLGTALALISPQPRARAVSPMFAIVRAASVDAAAERLVRGRSRAERKPALTIVPIGGNECA